MIRAGLREILAEIAGRVEFDAAAEDIHMNIETLLIEKSAQRGKSSIPPAAAMTRWPSTSGSICGGRSGKSRRWRGPRRNAARSRGGTRGNDQRPAIPTCMPSRFPSAIICWPILEMLLRDMGRFRDAARRMNVLPLGAGALAGTVFPLDREMVKEDLGFGAVSANSLDAGGSRLRAVLAAAILMMHLSRFSEEIIVWSSGEFGFLGLDDGYSTASIMPQKKIPMWRNWFGQTGRVYGDLMALLTV